MIRMQPQKTRARRPWRVITVGIFGLLLVVQGYFSFAIRPEPYPSIRMPSFGLAAAPDDTIAVTIARAEVIDRDGSIKPISVTDLMNQFRFSTARPSYDFLFRSSPETSVTAEVKDWLRQRIRDLNGTAQPAEIRMCWQESRVSIADASIISEGPCTWKVIGL